MIMKKEKEGRELEFVLGQQASALPTESSQAKCYRVAGKSEQQCAGDQSPKPYRQRS
jgi:hypothetical protein